MKNTYVYSHYADDIDAKPRIITESELISWAEDEIKNYQIYIDGELTPDKAMEIINDIGDVTINPNY